MRPAIPPRTPSSPIATPLTPTVSPRRRQETGGTPAASNNIVDAFDSTFNDSLTGHTFLLSGLDRYSATAGTTVGFWAFQNAVSVNANGTFSGVHTNGDLLFVVNVSVYGATSVAEYEWTGTDASGSLTQITPAVGAVYVYVNTNAVSVPWSFTDAGSNTSPQAGELLEIGVDLNAVYGLTVPTFKSFLAETRSSNTTGSSLLDFAVRAPLGTVSGSFTADGSLAPPYAIGGIVAVDGQNGINYNFGHVQPVTISGLVYQDTNGTGAYASGDSGIGGVTLTLTGTNNLGNPVTATTTTASNGTYSFTTYNSGQFLSRRAPTRSSRLSPAAIWRAAPTWAPSMAQWSAPWLLLARSAPSARPRARTASTTTSARSCRSPLAVRSTRTPTVTASSIRVSRASPASR